MRPAAAGTLPGAASRCRGCNHTSALYPLPRQRLRRAAPSLGLLPFRRHGRSGQASRWRCGAAASLSVSVAAPGPSNGVGFAGGAPKPDAASDAGSNRNNSNNSSSGSSSSPPSPSSSAGATAAAVAAQFPAVPPLPTPPGSGNLQDVVPYLIRLAFQERHLVWRLAAAVSCMVVAKLAGISLPLAFKGAVDAMSASAGVVATVNAALSAVLLYGALDCVKVMAKEAQSPIFAPVSQAVTRRVAYHTFSHVLGLDTRYHIDRRTGRVSRILERGTRSIAVLYRALIFTFLPTGLELAAVAALLATRFGPLLAGLLAATFAAYVTWTVVLTQRATEVRKDVNQLDNQASSKAVDALLNFETVTLFNNQRLEVGLYDKLLRELRAAALRAEGLSAGLNAGQGLILAGGMAAILAAIVASGTATGGDLVMASGLIVQLWAPLQFLGWFYRELRAALVDMEEFFQILRTSSNIRDGDQHLPTGVATGAAAAAAAAAAPAAAAGSPGAAPAAAAPAGATTFTSSSSSSGASSSVDGEGGPVGQPPASAPGGLQVELVDVRFGYSTERQILKGVSLRIAPGESVAVVGSSGSGKSTILKLVTRLYDVWPDGESAPGCSSDSGSSSSNTSSSSNGSHNNYGAADANSYRRNDSSSSSSSSVRHFQDLDPGTHAVSCSSSRQGEDGHPATDRNNGHANNGTSCSSGSSRPSGVYINGVDVRHLRLSDLRSAIAVVPQDTALSYDTIRENIRYGRPDASDAEVEAAAVMARLHDTVTALPDKYDTMVGERGLKLSGGEKQRVAIARAFLRSPRLLICDEATSALDSGTEVAIMDSLKELARGRSALFVAHRLSTVRKCDRILVLRAGVVVEEGSHEQLMANRGEYAAMWELQANAARAGAAGGVSGGGGDVSSSEDDDGGVTDIDSEMQGSEGEGGEGDGRKEDGWEEGEGPMGRKAGVAAGAGAGAGAAATASLDEMAGTAAPLLPGGRAISVVAAAVPPSAAAAAIRGPIRDA